MFLNLGVLEAANMPVQSKSVRLSCCLLQAVFAHAANSTAMALIVILIVTFVTLIAAIAVVLTVTLIVFLLSLMPLVRCVFRIVCTLNP